MLRGVYVVDITNGEWLAAGIAFVVVLLVFRFVMTVVFSTPDVGSFNPANPRHVDYVDWQRDRLGALSKGTASTGLTYLSVVVSALLKGGLNANQSLWLGLVGAGVLGCLLTAVAVWTAAGTWTFKHL